MQSDACVIVVDDDGPARQSLAWLLESVGQKVVSYASAHEFLDEYTGAPGCLVLDVRMPGMSGLELQRHVNEMGWCLPTIMVTGHGDVPMAVRAMRAGAFDFFQKPYNDQALLERTGQAISKARELWAVEQGRQKVLARYESLTRREKEIAQLVCEGLPSKSIADRLSLRSKTVEVYRANMMAKMEAKSVADLVQMILRIEGGAKNF